MGAVVVSIWGGGVVGSAVGAAVGSDVGAAVGAVVGSSVGAWVGATVVSAEGTVIGGVGGLEVEVVVPVVCKGVLVEDTASSGPHPSTSPGQLQTPISASQAVPAGHWKRYCWNWPEAQMSVHR